MSHVTIIWSGVATAALLLAILFGAVWIFDRKARAYLAFACEALSIVGIVVVELGMMYSTTAAEWGEWLRWFQVPIFLRTVALVVFIRLYFETGRPWLIWTIIASRALILVTGFLVDPNFNLAAIDSIELIPFLGEEVAIVGQATVSPYQWFATVSTFLALVFVADASITLWRRGTAGARRKVMVIGGAVFLSWIGMFATGQMAIYGAHLPSMLAPANLVLLIAMAFELSRDAFRTRRDVEELQRELAHTGRVSAVGSLSSSLTHELSQPLSAILINTRLGTQLLSRPDPDLQELQQILVDIQRDNQHAIDVIDRLRRLLKRRRVDFSDVRIEDLLADTFALLKSDAIARGVTLEFDSDAGLPMVHGDKVHLAQVLINLVMNGMDAVAAMPPGRRQVSIRAYADEGDWVEIAVRDSGRGVAPESLARMFEPFYTSKPTGMGMGLSVSRTIVVAHGGQILVEPGAGVGATFRVRLPAK